MNILINHCWCNDSIWGGVYDCDVIVTIYSVLDNESSRREPDPDWALVEKHPHPPGAGTFQDETIRLRPDVQAWLAKNIKDGVGRKKHGKGWAVGTDAYNSNSIISFHVFFQRQIDGMAFIKRWSVHKNPIHYLQYFKDIRMKLDPKTGRMKRVAR